MILTTNMTLNEMLEVEDVRYKRIYDRIFEIYKFCNILTKDVMITGICLSIRSLAIHAAVKLLPVPTGPQNIKAF